jgi:hypothetical protein
MDLIVLMELIEVIEVKGLTWTSVLPQFHHLHQDNQVHQGIP